MATSGTTSFSVTERDIITDALQDVGVLDADGAPDGSDIVLARRKLNMIVKQWTAQADFAPGLKMWTRRRAFLFMQSGQISYTLGPTGDECAANSYVTTTVTAAAAAGASTITVDSISGLATTMRIGVLLDGGSLQWTTINGAPAGSTVTLTAVLTDAVSIGARVFAYTAKPVRPVEILSASRRDTNGDDTPMDPNLSLDEYELIPSKSGLGTPSRIYFEATKANSTVYLDSSPEELTDVIRMVFLSYIEDSTATTDDVDFPAEWFRPLAAQLTIDLCKPFGRPVTDVMKLQRDESLAMARNAYPAQSVAFYQSEPDQY